MQIIFLILLFCTTTFAAVIDPQPPISKIRRTLPLEGKQLYKLSQRPQNVTTGHSKGVNTPIGSSDQPITYTGNWGGAIIETPPDNQTFIGVSTQLQLPNPSVPSFPTNVPFWSASAWCGLDGETDLNLIVQGGVTITLYANQTVLYQAWAQWFPAPIYYYPDFAAKANDTISIEIGAISHSKAWVVLANLNSGYSSNATISAPSSATFLQGQNAEWIVEDWLENGLDVALVNWGTVVFSNCSASTANQQVGLQSVVAIDIAEQGALLTNATIIDDSTLSVEYQQLGIESLPTDARALVSSTAVPLYNPI